ncbi:capsule biosynthesis protein [Muricoccus radiodurans]|uniref:capsule biosynthesis protein n=1 Tax=Muricoccus radiodurans TaxID=2231721 RepID=UPI003CE771D6
MDAAPRGFLFLQGPISPFFREVGLGLMARGHRVFRINLSLGDRMFWPEPNATDFTGRKEDWPGFLGAFLDANRITDMVLLGEQRPLHKQAIAMAKARGITVTVTDFGYLRPDWIVLERDGMNGESVFPRDPAAILELARDLPPPDLVKRHTDSFGQQAVWDILYHLAGLLPSRFRHHESHQLHHPLPVYAGMAVRLLIRGFENRRADRILEQVRHRGPLFLFAMQMETDYSIRAYSHYPDLDTAIREVIDSFAAHAPADAQLLIKVHPLDPGLKRWPMRVRRMARRTGQEARIHYLGGGNLGAITEAMQGVVTVNSTVGLRAIVDRLPVHALGQAVYKIPGLTHDGPLDRFWTEARPPDPILREAYLRALSWCVHIRGAFYARPGLDAAVRAAVHRLHHGLLNVPVLETPSS